MNRWVIENKLEKLLPRHRVVYCYFTGAALITSPELTEARMSFGKSGVLTTVLDAFFDDWGSQDERTNLVQAAERYVPFYFSTLLSCFIICKLVF